MRIEAFLLLRGQRTIQRIGQHRLALGALPAVARLVAGCLVPEPQNLRAVELSSVCHLDHLPFYTLQ